MRTSEIDMANSVEPADIDTSIDNTAWAFRQTYHKVLKSLTRSSYIWTSVLFDIPFKAAWKQIGEYRLHQTDPSNKRENSSRVDYDYKSVIQY